MNNTTTLDLDPSPWSGSKLTAELVKHSVLLKFGEETAKTWKPELTRTFKNWLQHGYRVRRGESGIKSYIILEDKKKGITRRKNYYLFHLNQVEPIS